MLHSVEMQVESALLFETPVEIYERVFRQLRPTLRPPEVELSFRRFTNLSSSIRLREGKLSVKISDLLQDAPAPVLEALAFILLSKLFRQRPPVDMERRYRLYLARVDVREDVKNLRQSRGRKRHLPAAGDWFDLEEVFASVNAQYFGGAMEKPLLGWSEKRSRTILGHFDSAHNAIVLSRIMDHPEVPRLVVEYVMFHEMLHLRHPVEHSSGRRKIHTPAFKQAEKEFPRLKEAQKLLKQLPRG